MKARELMEQQCCTYVCTTLDGRYYYCEMPTLSRVLGDVPYGQFCRKHADVRRLIEQQKLQREAS